MDISSFLEIAGVVSHAPTRSRKQLIKRLAAAASELTGVSERDLHHQLSGKSVFTGVGGGACVAHLHVEGTARVRGICVHLPQASSVGGSENVDVLFLLLSPMEATPDSLKALALVTRALRDPTRCKSIRAAGSVEALRQLLCAAAESHAA